MRITSGSCRSCAPRVARKTCEHGCHCASEPKASSPIVEKQQEDKRVQAQLPVPVRACLVGAAVMSLHSCTAMAVSAASGPPAVDLQNAQTAAANASISSTSSHVQTAADPAQLVGMAGSWPQAAQLVVSGLADATEAPPPYPIPDSMVTGTYVPGPIEVGWQIYVGSAVAAFPFVLGAYEFGKRILIQRR